VRRAEAMRSYGERLAKALEPNPNILAPLKLHYLRWVLFDNDTRFMYQGIFDTDFDRPGSSGLGLKRERWYDVMLRGKRSEVTKPLKRGLRIKRGSSARAAPKRVGRPVLTQNDHKGGRKR